jgi:hypothetical protein
MSGAIYITLYKRCVELHQLPIQSLQTSTNTDNVPASCASPPPAPSSNPPSTIIQAVGGALSTQSNGSSATGVNLGLAGLSLQVAVLFVFIALSIQYAFRYARDVRAGKVSGANFDGRFKFFATFISLAILVIFVRCVFRIYELSEGYSGKAFHDQGAFIGLESV